MSSEPKEPEVILNIPIQIQLFDEFAQRADYTHPLTVIIENSNKDTVYSGQFDSSSIIDPRMGDELQVIAKLPVGNYVISVLDNTNTYAPSITYKSIWHPENSQSYYNPHSVKLTKYPKFKVNVISVTDTVMYIPGSPTGSIGRAWLININCTHKGRWENKNVPRFFIRYTVNALSIPIADGYPYGPEAIIDGNREFILPEAFVRSELKPKKGDTFYVSIIEASAMAGLASLTQTQNKLINATGKNIQSFKCVY